MILYKLALERIIGYFNLSGIFGENEQRQMLLHKQPKKIYKTTLRTDKTMNLCVSTLLSVISFLVCLTIPFAALESPCEELKQKQLYTFYYFAKFIEKHLGMIDRTVVILTVILIYIWCKSVWDAIQKTNLKVSPWLERGKYVLPKKRRESLAFLNL